MFALFNQIRILIWRYGWNTNNPRLWNGDVLLFNVDDQPLLFYRRYEWRRPNSINNILPSLF